MGIKSEFFINIRNKPSWEEGVPLSLQSRDTQQFWLNEAVKAKNGITVSGVKIHPWLYWHVNFWQMFVDKSADLRIPQISYLRDNEFFINENLNRAETDRKGIVMFGSRRIGKTAFASSYIGWNATFKYGGVNSVVGGVQKDLDNITEYIDFGLDNVPEFFRYERVGTDWDKGITLGNRTVSNKRNVFSTMKITNVNMGTKKSTQKTAGLTPTSYFMDEIGKYACKKVFNTAKYSFSSEHGWRCIPILVGTGGEVEESQDAQSIINNPEIHNLLPMDWSLLERNCDKPTWVKKQWGIFVPAQMSIEPGLVKKDTTLDKYLKLESDELSKIKIKVTNWDKSTKILEDRRAVLKEKDNATYIDEVMFLPLDTDDCFLQTSVNPFPTLEATRHRKKLIQDGDLGKPCNIFKINGSTQIGYEFSDKQLANYPFEGGNIDSPVLIFEDPPIDNIKDSTYVGGLDHYKHLKASTDSIGSYYIFKRRVNLNDPFADRIVASYSSRPNLMSIFNNTVEMLMEGYGAETLQENADISFQQHLEAKHKASYWLANGEDWAKTYISKTAKQNNKYGLPPTEKNKEYLLKLVIDYTHEDIDLGEDEDGNRIYIKGVERIPDIYLLDEIINYKTGKNCDRITAFGHALAWARYLDGLNIMPKIKREKDDKYNRTVKKEKVRNKSPYSLNRYSPYKK